jgi:hypothetical protein
MLQYPEHSIPTICTISRVMWPKVGKIHINEAPLQHQTPKHFHENVPSRYNIQIMKVIEDDFFIKFALYMFMYVYYVYVFLLMFMYYYCYVCSVLGIVFHCDILCIVLCKCVLYYCYRVPTQLQLANIP